MKFTIRDLLLVTVIVAVLLAWLLDRTMLIRHYESLLNWHPPGLDD
jgi:uncharacterized membrane protein AbrB (regulator of aidB expression)